MELRRATADDADVFTDVYLASRAAATMPAGVRSEDDVREYTRRVLPEREAWLAFDGDRAVGVLILDGDDLQWLFTHPDAQGQGVGSTLMNHAKAQRPGGLALWVFEMNTPAQRFYERHGFVAVRRTDGDNEEGAPDIRYVWGAHPEATPPG